MVSIFAAPAVLGMGLQVVGVLEQQHWDCSTRPGRVSLINGAACFDKLNGMSVFVG